MQAPRVVAPHLVYFSLPDKWASANGVAVPSVGGSIGGAGSGNRQSAAAPRQQQGGWWGGAGAGAGGNAGGGGPPANASFPPLPSPAATMLTESDVFSLLWNARYGVLDPSCP